MNLQLVRIRRYPNFSAACAAEEQIAIRQKLVRYAQQHGNKPAARHYGCHVETVREWCKRFENEGAGGLENKTRAPLEQKWLAN